jgi:hypothetical protein
LGGQKQAILKIVGKPEKAREKVEIIAEKKPKEQK